MLIKLMKLFRDAFAFAQIVSAGCSLAVLHIRNIYQQRMNRHNFRGQFKFNFILMLCLMFCKVNFSRGQSTDSLKFHILTEIIQKDSFINKGLLICQIYYLKGPIMLVETTCVVKQLLGNYNIDSMKFELKQGLFDTLEVQFMDEGCIYEGEFYRCRTSKHSYKKLPEAYREKYFKNSYSTFRRLKRVNGLSHIWLRRI